MAATPERPDAESARRQLIAELKSLLGSVELEIDLPRSRHRPEDVDFKGAPRARHLSARLR